MDPPLLSSCERAPQIAGLDQFVAKAMSRAPEVRFESAKIMLEAWWQLNAELDAAAAPAHTEANPAMFDAVDEPFGTRESQSLRHAVPTLRSNPPPAAPRPSGLPPRPSGLPPRPSGLSPAPLSMQSTRSPITQTGGSFAGPQTGPYSSTSVSFRSPSYRPSGTIEVDIDLDLPSDDQPTLRSEELGALVAEELRIARERRK
jgi:hypothetical protein